jgi:hypothetical protein
MVKGILVSTSPKESRPILTALIKLPHSVIEIKYPEVYKNKNIHKITLSREPETEREIFWAIKLEEQILKRIKCLKCSEAFMPRGRYNKLCDRCNNENNTYAKEPLSVWRDKNLYRRILSEPETGFHYDPERRHGDNRN